MSRQDEIVLRGVVVKPLCFNPLGCDRCLFPPNVGINMRTLVVAGGYIPTHSDGAVRENYNDSRVILTFPPSRRVSMPGVATVRCEEEMGRWLRREGVGARGILWSGCTHMHAHHMHGIIGTRERVTFPSHYAYVLRVVKKPPLGYCTLLV